MADARSRLILVVEDSDEDYESTRRALIRGRLKNPLRRLEDGDEALDYLKRRGQYATEGAAPRPGMVLLDLGLPGTDGLEVLRAIKADPELRDLPVIMLTTSTDERDIDECYEAGANSYVPKPVDPDKFFGAIQRLQEYWFEISVLPAHETPE